MVEARRARPKERRERERGLRGQQVRKETILEFRERGVNSHIIQVNGRATVLRNQNKSRDTRRIHDPVLERLKSGESERRGSVN